MRCLAVALMFAFVAVASAADEPKPLKVGIIGLDTSHVAAFTQLLNDPKADGDLAGIRVVAAFPGGSKDIESSRSRVEGFTKTLKEKHGVEVVNSIDELLGKVDVVLLESVDGRPHLEQARPVIKAKKPVFIDKPVGGTLADAIEIFDLAKANNVPVFSSSPAFGWRRCANGNWATSSPTRAGPASRRAPPGPLLVRIHASRRCTQHGARL